MRLQAYINLILFQLLTICVISIKHRWLINHKQRHLLGLCFTTVEAFLWDITFEGLNRIIINQQDFVRCNSDVWLGGTRCYPHYIILIIYLLYRRNNLTMCRLKPNKFVLIQLCVNVHNIKLITCLHCGLLSSRGAFCGLIGWQLFWIWFNKAITTLFI